MVELSVSGASLCLVTFDDREIAWLLEYQRGALSRGQALSCGITPDALRRADQLETEAARHRVNAAGHLARQLAGGKTRAELAAELGWLPNDLRRALRGAPVTRTKETA